MRRLVFTKPLLGCGVGSVWLSATPLFWSSPTRPVSSAPSPMVPDALKQAAIGDRPPLALLLPYVGGLSVGSAAPVGSTTSFHVPRRRLALGLVSSRLATKLRIRSRL